MIRRYASMCLLIVSLISLMIGCSDLGRVLQLKPDARVSTLALDFGTVAVHQSSARSLTIHNLGTGPLTVSPSLSNAAYTLVNGANSFIVPPGGQNDIDVRFTPSATGSFPCTLDLGAESPSVALSGDGALQAPGAQCVLLPTTVDYGFVATGNSAPSTFQVFSTGTAPLLINVVSSAPDIQILAGGGQATLDPGQSKSVVANFVPQAGGRFSGTVAIGAGCPDLVVQGVGTTVSWDKDVRPIFAAKCTCHAYGDSRYGYLSLVNYPSNYSFPTPNVVVKPFDLINSVLYGKITNSGQFGPLMPQGGPLLPAHDTDLIRTWITEGASNN
jgi:hypothetical protein